MDINSSIAGMRFAANPPRRRRGTLGGLLHAMFAGGRGEMAELRSWYRRILWQDCTALSSKLRAAATVAGWPLIAVRRAYEVVRLHGDNIERAHGASHVYQFLQVTWLVMRYGFEADTYYRYRLYDPARWPHAEHFLQSNENIAVMHALITRTSSDDARQLRDKRLFHSRCLEYGLATVPVLAEFADGTMRKDRTGGMSRQDDLFSKPAIRARGENAARWLRTVRGYESGGVTVPDFAALLKELARRSGDGALILQPAARNHSQLAQLTTGALCTVRMITYRVGDADSELLLAAYRMPFAGSPVDNFEQGGLAAPVDLETGQLGPARRKLAKHCLETWSEHPATGARIDGVQLPHWSRARQLVRDAHAAFPSMMLVAWDVAILDSGPVALEGNRVPGSKLSQMPSGDPLGATPLIAEINRRMRLAYG